MEMMEENSSKTSKDKPDEVKESLPKRKPDQKEGEWVKSKIRFEFTVKSHIDVNIDVRIKEIIGYILKPDSNTRICSQSSGKTFQTMEEFPKEPSDVEEYFSPMAVEHKQAGHTKVLFVLHMTSTRSFGTIKKYDYSFRQFYRQNKIFMHQHCLSTLLIQDIGIFVGRNPNTESIDSVTKEVKAMLLSQTKRRAAEQQSSSLAPIPLFEISPRTITHIIPATTTTKKAVYWTKAHEIRCSRDDAKYLRSLIHDAHIQLKGRAGIFLPKTYAHDNKDDYARLIMKQNEYLDKVRTIAVSGIHPDLMYGKYKTEEGTWGAFHDYIMNQDERDDDGLMSPLVTRICPAANVAETGRWQIHFLANQRQNVQHFIDKELPGLYKSCLAYKKYHDSYPQYPEPTRTYKDETDYMKMSEELKSLATRPTMTNGPTTTPLMHTPAARVQCAKLVYSGGPLKTTSNQYTSARPAGNQAKPARVSQGTPATPGTAWNVVTNKKGNKGGIAKVEADLFLKNEFILSQYGKKRKKLSGKNVRGTPTTPKTRNTLKEVSEAEDTREYVIQNQQDEESNSDNDEAHMEEDDTNKENCKPGHNQPANDREQAKIADTSSPTDNTQMNDLSNLEGMISGMMAKFMDEIKHLHERLDKIEQARLIVQQAKQIPTAKEGIDMIRRELHEEMKRMNEENNQAVSAMYTKLHREMRKEMENSRNNETPTKVGLDSPEMSMDTEDDSSANTSNRRKAEQSPPTTPTKPRLTKRQQQQQQGHTTPTKTLLKTLVEADEEMMEQNLENVTCVLEEEIAKHHSTGIPTGFSAALMKASAAESTKKC